MSFLSDFMSRNWQAALVCETRDQGKGWGVESVFLRSSVQPEVSRRLWGPGLGSGQLESQPMGWKQVLTATQTQPRAWASVRTAGL